MDCWNVTVVSFPTVNHEPQTRQIYAPRRYKLDESLQPVGERDDWGFRGEWIIDAGTHERCKAVRV